MWHTWSFIIKKLNVQSFKTNRINDRVGIPNIFVKTLDSTIILLTKGWLPACTPIKYYKLENKYWVLISPVGWYFLIQMFVLIFISQAVNIFVPPQVCSWWSVNHQVRLGSFLQSFVIVPQLQLASVSHNQRLKFQAQYCHRALSRSAEQKFKLCWLTEIAIIALFPATTKCPKHWKMSRKKRKFSHLNYFQNSFFKYHYLKCEDISILEMTSWGWAVPSSGQA